VPEPPPPEVERHVPLIEKHPVFKTMPFANVDVAPVTLSAVVSIPAANVEVAFPVTAKFVVVAFPKIVLDAKRVFDVGLNVKLPEPANVPLPPLNCTEFKIPVDAPALALMHTPFTDTQPPVKFMPPANVEVLTALTARLAVVVVPLTEILFTERSPLHVESEIVTDFIVPPVIAGFVMIVPLKLSMRCVRAISFVNPPEAGGVETLVIE